MSDLRRQIAEALGWRLEQRHYSKMRPDWWTLVDRDGNPYRVEQFDYDGDPIPGSGNPWSYPPSEPEEKIWEYALGWLPDWPEDIAAALELISAGYGVTISRDRYEGYWTCIIKSFSDSWDGEGDTPEIAICNAWLAWKDATK